MIKTINGTKIKFLFEDGTVRASIRGQIVDARKHFGDAKVAKIVTERIAELNDQLRRNIWTAGPKNKVVMSSGLAANPKLAADALAAVRQFNKFDDENDPHGEHDMGLIEIDGEKVMFKIDYYDEDMTFHSEDPADPAVTIRVLTVMFASDY